MKTNETRYQNNGSMQKAIDDLKTVASKCFSYLMNEGHPKTFILDYIRRSPVYQTCKHYLSDKELSDILESVYEAETAPPEEMEQDDPVRIIEAAKMEINQRIVYDYEYLVKSQKVLGDQIREYNKLLVEETVVLAEIQITKKNLLNKENELSEKSQRYDRTIRQVNQKLDDTEKKLQWWIGVSIYAILGGLVLLVGLICALNKLHTNDLLF